MYVEVKDYVPDTFAGKSHKYVNPNSNTVISKSRQVFVFSLFLRRHRSLVQPHPLCQPDGAESQSAGCSHSGGGRGGRGWQRGVCLHYFFQHMNRLICLCCWLIWVDLWPAGCSSHSEELTGLEIQNIWLGNEKMQREVEFLFFYNTTKYLKTQSTAVDYELQLVSCTDPHRYYQRSLFGLFFFGPSSSMINCAAIAAVAVLLPYVIRPPPPAGSDTWVPQGEDLSLWHCVLSLLCFKIYSKLVRSDRFNHH